MPRVLAHAPLLLGLLLNNQNNNDSAVVKTRTLVVHEQIAEANYLHDTINELPEAGVLHHLHVNSAEPQEDLTHEQRDFYKRNGYLIIPHVLTSEEASSLLNDAHDVMKRISKGGNGITRHDASANGGRRSSPIGRVLATFETANTSTSDLFEQPIARLGCGIHQCMPSFRTLTDSPHHRLIAKSLGCGTPRVTQSQLIAKLADIGGAIVPHQDGCISFTKPTSGMTFWYALEDATVENGCLLVAPGSHLTEPLTQRLTKGKGEGDDIGLPNFEDLKEPLWAEEGNGDKAKGSKEVGVGPLEYEYEYKPLEVKQGTLVVFHGNLMHTSGANPSLKSRIAYTFSIINGEAECPDDSYMKPVVGDYESL